MKRTYVLLLIFHLLLLSVGISAQNSWEAASYPDEAGFQLRIKNALPLLAEKGFGIITRSTSKCPDTGLPVYTYALEGEDVISPYTGRKYKQPATDYFSPKMRNEQGEISSFGGDPLKYDLPTATASMLLGVKKKEAKAYLSIPGNLSQQYHFACKNWVRFYPLLADSMGDAWKLNLQKSVAIYTTNRRVTDNNKAWLKLSYPNDLVGQSGMLLGGNPIDGGTENHKIMWRTSALLYAQIFPDSALISGYPTKVAEKMTKTMLHDFAKKLLVMGNGEYDSEIYYPHSIEGFLNLYDFSPDPDTRLLAKFVLDYYFATYGLKVVDGMIAGAQKRGYLSTSKLSEMQIMLWAFCGVGKGDWSKAEIPIHVVTTTYRPNKVILNILQKKIALPFEGKMSRPFYQMDRALAFAESFYCSNSYALGNSQTSIVDNPNQQMVWSLVAQGERRPLCFSGGEPLRGSSSGHSPYTQTLHSKGTMVVMTAPSVFTTKLDTVSPPTPAGVERANYWLLPFSEQPKDYERSARQKYAWKALHQAVVTDVSDAVGLERFWNDSKGSASTWFVFPKEINAVLLHGTYYFETSTAWIAVKPFSGNTCVEISPLKSVVSSSLNGEVKKFFCDYKLISCMGEVSGYVMESCEKSRFATLSEWDAFLQNNTQLLFSADEKTVNYHSSFGEKMEFRYQADQLRPAAKLNGNVLDFDNYTKGAVYQTPYLNVKNGVMKVTDGVASYTVDFRGKLPVYK